MRDRLRKLTSHRVVRKGASLALLLYLSPIVGMILEITLIRVFSAGAVLDSFRALMTFMLMGQGVVTSQLLKYALIPKLAQFRARNQDREGLVFAFYFTMQVLLILSPILFIGLVLPDQMLQFLAPGFDAGIRSQSAHMVQVATCGFGLLIVMGAMTAILNFHGVFWGQPVATLILNSTILIAVLCFGYRASEPSTQFQLLELATSTGLLCMLLLMSWQCMKVWLRTYPQGEAPPLKHTLYTSLLALMPQLILVAAELGKHLSVNRVLSELGEGTIVLYMLAFKLFMVGLLPVIAVVTIIFPDFSRLKTSTDDQQLAAKISNGSLRIFLLSAAASVVIWLLAPIIIDIISFFANIELTARDLVVEVYRAFLLFTPFSSLCIFYMESSYAFGRKKIVLTYSVINTAIIAFLMPVFGSLGALNVVYVYTWVQGVCTVIFGLALYYSLKRAPARV
ncbi:MAG: hypothetical protein CMK83_09655 [Pseudomonadales bacterium]|jgi:peptidoglycan biosynthesis protein MviN/MurJ (putative lipid II flippase)|uniref:lipid II flippase MurJ n=1 Tax=unclassified Ketobacter TaxID=2639109 RepID=UPI000C391859|nr:MULTISPECIES: lipid II flippase MurJ [unclassified Ketobacter]MAQ24475.1 hypothetical protein [Pseudomonadales bacterium]MEC8812929.1 lipid II flippase MurJ [Pseudomonadota bacterium]TNC88053.1 MAG: hypothetical protein CSH49_13130 [Alcanivorax sp.]HAG97263.1 hypothetical protein [Gammaproteobacteria bacterium]MBI25379.1 hypothetical protein [Pseudomonadales bacterium]|tara:strand:- start:4313 stop:5668 length:1356 start_codon:yes stop_codon:yes gene_type:complete